MKLLLINEVCGTGSTGKICAKIAEEYEEKGYICKIAYGRDGNVPDQYEKYAVRIGNDFGVRLHALSTRLFDNTGFCSSFATKRFLKWADNYNPDVLWLHNLHGYYINVELLFKWIKSRPNMKVKWTLHDCWAFTGHCTYFTFVKCNKWRKQCSKCPQRKEYPKSIFFDNSYYNYKRKMKAFCGVRSMKIITPSKWLSNLVKKSFLRKYPVEVHYNTIDTNVFKPTDSDFRRKHNIENKTIVLAVSNAWQEPRKGLLDIYKIREKLDNNFIFVIVGLNQNMIKELPEGIIGIMKTNSSVELAGFYSIADVLINPTYEDNYPTVNLEAQACGTPVITYRTGGSPESVPSENVVDVGNIDKMVESIKRFQKKKERYV